MSFQMKFPILRNLLSTGLLTLALCSGRATTAEAIVTLQAPQSVAQGSALRVWAMSDTPVASITFNANGKSLTATTLPSGDAWEAEAMFPIDVDATRAVVVTASADKHRITATIPVTRVNWPVQKISVEPKYVSPPKSVMNRIASDREKSSAVLNRITPQRYWNEPFQRPVPGAVSSGFGGKRVFNGQTRSYHKGTDLRGQTGTPILALADGIVAISDDMYFSGNVVYVDHGQGVVSIYAHMSRRDVRPGDKIIAGQTLGLVGATGRVTGPHLHLGLSVLGKSVNPLSLFPASREE